MYSPESYEIDIRKIYWSEKQLNKTYPERPWIMVNEMIDFVQKWVIEYTEPYVLKKENLADYQNQLAYYEKRLKERNNNMIFPGMEYFVTDEGAYKYGSAGDKKILSFKHPKFLLFFAFKAAQFVLPNELKLFLKYQQKEQGRRYASILKELLENRYIFLLPELVKECLKEESQKAESNTRLSMTTRPYYMVLNDPTDAKKLYQLLNAAQVILPIEFDYFLLHFSNNIGYKAIPKLEWLRPKHEIVYFLEKLKPEVISFNSKRINILITEHFEGCQNIRQLKQKAHPIGPVTKFFYSQIIDHFT